MDIIGSDCSRAGVDEETTIVWHQRRWTDGATAVRRLDDDGRGGWLCVLFCVLFGSQIFIYLIYLCAAT